VGDGRWGYVLQSIRYVDGYRQIMVLIIHSYREHRSTVESFGQGDDTTSKPPSSCHAPYTGHQTTLITSRLSPLNSPRRKPIRSMRPRPRPRPTPPLLRATLTTHIYIADVRVVVRSLFESGTRATRRNFISYSRDLLV
jgi:hypothetical protein